MPVVITAIGFSIFIDHDGDPFLYRITKQCRRRYFPIHKFSPFGYGFRDEDFGEDDREESVASQISSALDRIKCWVTMGTPFVTAVYILIAKNEERISQMRKTAPKFQT